MIGDLIRRWPYEDGDTGRTPDKDEDWDDIEDADKPPEARRSKEEFLYRLYRGNTVLRHLDLRRLASRMARRTISVFISCLVLP